MNRQRLHTPFARSIAAASLLFALAIAVAFASAGAAHSAMAAIPVASREAAVVLDGDRADDESPNSRLEVAGQFGGTINAVALHDGVAWVGVGPRVLTFDVSDPREPVQIGATGMLPQIVRGIDVAADHVFVAMSGQSTGDSNIGAYLWSFDAGTPESPAVVGRLEAETGWLNVSIEDGIACLGDWDGIALIDISDPGRMSIGEMVPSFPGEVCSMLPGRRMVVATDDGLQLYDVSDPEAPAILDTSKDAGWMIDLAIAGDVVLGVVDVDGDHGPLVRAVTWANDRLAVVSDDLGIADAGAIGTHGSRLTVLDYCCSGDVRFYDIDDLAAPRLEGTAPVPELGPEVVNTLYPQDIAMDGVAIAIAGAFTGLYTIDASDPAQAIVSPAYTGPTYVNDVLLHEGLAYVSSPATGLWVLDAADPARPSVLGHVFPSPDGDSFPDLGALTWSDGHVYALDRFYPDGRLRIFDVGDPRAPTEVGSVALPSYPSQIADIVVAGGLAFVPLGDVMAIIDVADPAHPQVMSATKYRSAKSIAVIGTMAYVGSELDKLVVLDVRDPARPVEIGRIDAPVKSMTRDGDRLFVSVESHPLGSMRVYDLADPAHPTQIAELAENYVFPSSIAVASGFAFRDIGFGYDLVYVGDLPRLTTTNRIDSFPHGTLYYMSAAFSISAEGDYAYSAQGETGLLILHRADAPPPAPPLQTDPPTHRLYLPAVLGKGAPAAAQAACTVTHAALVLDTSRDRGGGPPGAPAAGALPDADYLAAIRAAARAFARAVDRSAVNVSILSFDRQTEALAPAARGDLDLDALDLRLAALDLAPGRRIDVALAAAARTVRGAGAVDDAAAVVLVAAGPPDRNTAGRAVAEAARLRAAGIGVTTVAFGAAADAPLLAVLAESADGAFGASTADDLVEVLRVVGAAYGVCAP